jgi:hypothetical protein
MSFLPAWMKVGRTVTVLALVAAGFVMGDACRDTAVQAEVRDRGAPQAFNSGAQRSETHLAEISGTLKRIDERLARLEKLANRTLARDTKPEASAEDRR